MDTVRASIVWAGPAVDILRLFVEPATDSGAVVHDEDIVLFCALDEQEAPTGPVTGVEIISFLEFDSWENLPDLGLLLLLPGQKPLPLDELLKRAQKELRQQAKATA